MNLKKIFGFEKQKDMPLSKKSAPDFYEKLVQMKNVEGMYNVINKLPNPDPILRKTGKGIEALRLLEYEGQVATCLKSRKSGIKSLNWTLKHTDKKYIKFYADLFKGFKTRKFISSVLNAPLYGFQPMEVIWEKNGQYVLPKEITAPPQEWFFFNTENQLCFKKKGRSEGLILKPEEKKFLCPTEDGDTSYNPYGKSVLSLCFWDVAFKRGGYEFWVKFMEKYSMPYFIGKYERGTDEDSKLKLLECLSKMVQDAVSVIPNDSSVEIIEPSGKSASAEIYKDFIKICDSNIAKNILGQTLTTETGDTGSYALGEIHARVRDDIINSDKTLVEETANILLSWIHEINFGNCDHPMLELSPDAKINKELAGRDKILYDFGVRFTTSYIQKSYNMDKDDFSIADVAQPNTETKEFSESVQSDPQFTLDQLNKIFDVPDGNVDKSIIPVVELFSETKDPTTTLENLAEIYPNMDFSELEKTLAQVIFISELWGAAAGVPNGAGVEPAKWNTTATAAGAKSTTER